MNILAATACCLALADAPEPRRDPLVIPTTLWLAGGAADVLSTVRVLQHPNGFEANPMINWAGDRAALPIGAAMETAGYLALRAWLGKDHPKWLAAALYGMAAVHGTLAVRNVRLRRDMDAGRR